jgi:hypothetical protein
MSEQTVFLIFAAMAILVFPLVPKMVMFEIKTMRFLHLNSSAGRHERDYAVIVFIKRALLMVMAVFFLMKAIFG